MLNIEYVKMYIWALVLIPFFIFILLKFFSNGKF